MLIEKSSQPLNSIYAEEVLYSSFPSVYHFVHESLHYLQNFAQSIWFGYVKGFLRRFAGYAVTYRPKSTRKYLFYKTMLNNTLLESLKHTG